MKKILILTMVSIFALSVGVGATTISDMNYSTFDNGSLLDFTVTTDVSDKIVVRGTYSIMDTIIGSYNKFDILGGYKYIDQKNNSTYLFMGGFRQGEVENGLLLSGDIRTNLSGKYFMHDILEFVSWSESDVTALSTKFMIGYKINDKTAIKGGINWIQSGGENDLGPMFGFETSF